MESIFLNMVPLIGLLCLYMWPQISLRRDKCHISWTLQATAGVDFTFRVRNLLKPKRKQSKLQPGAHNSLTINTSKPGAFIIWSKHWTALVVVILTCLGGESRPKMSYLATIVLIHVLLANTRKYTSVIVSEPQTSFICTFMLFNTNSLIYSFSKKKNK